MSRKNFGHISRSSIPPHPHPHPSSPLTLSRHLFLPLFHLWYLLLTCETGSTATSSTQSISPLSRCSAEQTGTALCMRVRREIDRWGRKIIRSQGVIIWWRDTKKQEFEFTWKYQKKKKLDITVFVFFSQLLCKGAEIPQVYILMFCSFLRVGCCVKMYRHTHTNTPKPNIT